MKYTLARRSSGERIVQEAVLAEGWVLTDHGHLQFIDENRNAAYMVNSRSWVSVKAEGPQDAKPPETWTTASLLSKE